MKYKNVSSSNIAAIRYDGMFPGGTKEGKLVYLAIPFESIYNESARVEIMAKVFDYFDYVSNIEDHHRPIAEKFRLFQNYPNPFNPSTTIAFQLPQSSHVRLDIYNLRGELVRTLVNEVCPAGYRTRIWDSRNSAGLQQPSGMYIYRLTTEREQITRNMLLLK